MSGDSRKVLIVGGGVIGAACAYYLSRSGCQVVIIERGTMGSGCSHGNCGFVCPSHVLPLAIPGAIGNAVRSFFSRNAPLKIRWRLDPSLWNWFLRFSLNCSHARMIQSGHAIQALLTSSRELYDELLLSDLTDLEWQTLGLMFVFQTPRAFDHYAQIDELLRREFNLSATRHDADALQSVEPALKPGIAGAWHYMTDAHLRPDKLMAAWRRCLLAQGVELIEQCELIDLSAQGRVVKSLTTSRGELSADQVIIAAGAWSRDLRKLLRVPIAIQPGKGYSLTMSRPKICPRIPMLFEEHHVAITPMASGYRIGSTMEFAGFDNRLRPDRLKLLRHGAETYLREPFGEGPCEEWFGFRPMTPDSLPLLGRVPAFDNLYLAAGHGMLGVSMSPATGKLLAEMLTGQVPHVDPLPYAVDRAT